MFQIAKNRRIQDREFWKILEDAAIYISQARGEHLIFGNYIDQYYAVFRHNLVSQNFKKAIYDVMIESMGRYDASDVIDGIELLYFRNYDEPHEYQKTAEKLKEQIIQDMNQLKLEEVLRLIDLYEYDKDFRKFLLYNLSEKYDKYAGSGFKDSISEEYLKKAFELLIANSKSDLETMNIINFFI